MHFTKEIRPYDIDNCATIMEWIKERRAYVKLPSHTSFVLWHTMASQPNFHELWVSGVVFKAEVKQAPKFEIGQRVNIAEAKRVAPNPDYAYGIVIDFEIDVDDSVTYKLHLRSGPYRREMVVEEKYLVLAEHAAQPVSEPKFKAGQKVKIVADNTGWQGTYATVHAVEGPEVNPGEVCVLGDVAKKYRWYKPYQLELEEKPQPKFKVGQLVHVTGQHGISPNQSCRVMSFAQLNTGRVNYEVRVDGLGMPIRAYEEQLTAVEEKPHPKFKAGDRVYLSCEGHYHNKQTGTVQIAYSDHDCLVNFDGHGCEHTVPETSLWLVKFAPGQRVSVAPGDRLNKYTKLEVVKVLGKNGDRLLYQLKATKAEGDATLASALEDGMSVALVEAPVATIPKVHHDEAIRWAEGLILQIPQNHGGRNSWLMNYGSADKEILTDPVAVATLLHAKAVIHMTTENGTTIAMNPGMEAENVKVCMKAGATFTWMRKEKRDA